MIDVSKLELHLAGEIGAGTSITLHSHSCEIVLAVPADRLRSIISTLRQDFAAVFVDLFGLDTRASRGVFQLHLLAALDTEQTWLHLVTNLDAQSPTFTSLVEIFPAAGWYERMLWEELDIVPQRHPLLRRLRLAPDWPEEVRPALQGFAWGQQVLPIEPRYFELEEAPPGVVDYPLGPVRSGIVESGHYTLRTVGEELVDCYVQLFYKHRGVEQRAVGMPIELMPLVAERISGTSAFAHSLALCQALERLTGIEVPQRARLLRVLLAELERLYNHLGYQADLCQATGLVVAQAQFDLWKERVLRLNAQVSGHRYLFGMNIPGGLSRPVTEQGLAEIAALVSALQKEIQVLSRQLLASPSHRDRLENTGILTPSSARDYCAVGPIGRASGVNRDLRRDHPYAAYAEMDYEVPVRQEGDALARARVRLEEAEQSLLLISQALERLEEGPVAAFLPPITHGGAALGWAESARGESVHCILVGDDGKVVRYRVRPASFANWQAFPLAIPGHNILTDFPVIEQSFGLSFAGADS
jgi:Ni,Fe-hydrogenase III large subunit/Ni,Fe-hydrogenase III component G